jgi:glutamate-1-semialdehyde 2,1-aminomutase
MVYLSLDANGAASQPFRTLFMQEIARAGILAPSLVTSYSHTNDDIDRTIDAVDRALAVYRKALENGIDHYLEGPSVRPVFTRNGDGVSEAVLAPIIHTDAKSRRAPRTRLVTRRGAQLRSLPI